VTESLLMVMMILDVVVEVMELLKREVDAGNFSFVFSGSVHTAKAIIR